MKEQFAYCRGLNVQPLVRPPGKDYYTTALLLDLGAMGVMWPMVESAAEAAELVSYTRYARSREDARTNRHGHNGIRGALFGGAHDDYRGGDVGDKMRQIAQRTLNICLIETAEGLANVDEIAATPGVDVLHLGHFALALSLGTPSPPPAIPPPLTHPPLRHPGGI